ncbi:hypothetical protein [Luteolibacter pohnpeiensis]|nr:hypothetical protein [Luteolibacter pohnpeiensis]
MDIQRNVAVLRLKNDQLVIHSTAPFSEQDIQDITSLGNPTWLVDALLRHSTFAREGVKAFPDARYLAPPGFDQEAEVTTENLLQPPAEWSGEIEVLSIDGAPDFGEIVMLHVASKTLVVCDLIINFPHESSWIQKQFLKLGSVGGKSHPGMTKPFQNAIQDRAAFIQSIRKLLEWDFDRIIIGHGDRIESNGKRLLAKVFMDAGYPVQ